VILDPDHLVAGYPFLARRLRRVSICDAVAVRGCCVRAEALAAGDTTVEPAAMFMAFAEKRRAFPFAWKAMAVHIARSQARANGLELDASEDELGTLCVSVLRRQVVWDDVCTWFSTRRSPRTPRTPP